LGEVHNLLTDGDYDVVAVERPTWMRGKRQTSTATQEALVMALGIVEAMHAACCDKNTELVLVDPNQAKYAVCGRKTADKQQVRRALTERGFDVGYMNEDESDALAIAFYVFRGEK